MRFGNLLFGVLAVSVFAGNAMAANKTRLMDTQGSGHSRFDLSLGFSQGSGETRSTSLGTTLNIKDKSSSNNLSLGYAYGLTDRFDLVLLVPLVGNETDTSEYSFAGSQYKTTWRYEGSRDISLTANYQLMTKQANGFNWNIAGEISPSTASSTGATAERTVNGVVTVAGTKGKFGRGYTQMGVGTMVGLPTAVGDVVVEGKIYRGGESTDAGVKTTYGSGKSFNVYLESAVSTTTTLTPYVGYSSLGTTTSAGTTYPSFNYYLAGLIVTTDVSNRVSLRGSLNYSKMQDYTYSFTGGSVVSTFSSYSVGLTSMFFF